MLRPERMTRAVIAGPRERLAPTIEVLHSMKLLHIVDHRGADETFGIGKPLPQASDLSDSLVKLRSVTSILGATQAPKVQERVALADLRQKILSLEINIAEEDAGRKKTEALLTDLGRRADALRPFADLGLPLDLYRGFDALAVFAGRASRPVEGLEAEIPRSEVFQASGAVAVFVRKDDAEKTSLFLGRFGFSQVDPPNESGDPRALLGAAQNDLEKWRARLEEAQGRLEKLRERYAGFVVAAQEVLEVEVEKAEAPLRFAVSDHSFVIDGWVPRSRMPELSSHLAHAGVYVEESTTPSVHGGPSEEPPVLLKNPKPAKVFEFLIHLYSTPNYHELDPTVFILIAFPFFFGFMIGDAGYGAVFFLLGVAALRKLPKESDFRNLLAVIMVGGFWALVFGLFVFGEAFGIPFHSAPLHPEELDWQGLVGFNFPLQPLIHKAFGLADMIYLSILFAAFHLGTSFLIGFVNEVRHNAKHALGKIGWFMCVFGIFTLLTRALSWTRSGGWVWNVALAWFPKEVWPALSSFLGVGIPYASLALILGACLGILESPVAPLEIGGLLANMISYTRLAAIGVGKAAIATSFNTLILEGLILRQGVVSAIVGMVLLVMAQMMVFLLGGISAGIQGLRLHYVESFTKFYKGNGTRFRPFGTRLKQEA